MACVHCRIEMCFLCTQPKADSDKCCCNGLHGEEPPVEFVAPEPKIVYVEREPKEPVEKRPVGRPRIIDRDPETDKPVPKTDLVKRLWKEKVPFDGEIEKNPPGRPRKEGADMVNVKAAGRKRAQFVAPFEEGMKCEWAGLKNAGGGIKPITGCAGLLVSHRHHGPDKNVLNNELGVNLHRICSKCHNRWHALNDPFYGERPEGGLPFLPITGGAGMMHDPHTKATPQEMMENELWWLKSIEERASIEEEKLPVDSE